MIFKSEIDWGVVGTETLCVCERQERERERVLGRIQRREWAVRKPGTGER